MRKFIVLLSLFLVVDVAMVKAQDVIKQSFENLTKDRAKQGVKGLALNLEEDAYERTPIKLVIDKKITSESFSLLFWVKAGIDDFDYDILTLLFGKEDSVSTKWSIGKQTNGAWCWSSINPKGKIDYEYKPTSRRQNIIGAKWNMIGVSYDASRGDVWFYFNGENVAIYHVDAKYQSEENGLLWIGGQPKGVLLEWDTFNGSIDELEVHNVFLQPKDIEDRYKKFYPDEMNSFLKTNDAELKVMSFNIWHGGNHTGKYMGPQRVVKLIKDNEIDIVGLQETYGSGAQIADALGYFFYLRSSNLSILSRYPIQETLLAYHSFNSGAVRIEYPKGKEVVFATNWLNYPIDYWALLENKKTIDTLDWHIKQASGNKKTLQRILDALQPSLDTANNLPFIFCGDFNSGSHLDWTEETRHLNNGYVMPFPSTKLMLSQGFKDAYRQVYPDHVRARGITWSPTFKTAFKDRIDYIFYRGKGINVKDAGVIDHYRYKFPSDHAAVIATFEIH